MQDTGVLTHVLISEHEGKPLLGPTCMCFDQNGTLYFTDSGPMGSFSAPKGSVYSVSSDDQLLKPLAKSCLANPTGVRFVYRIYVGVKTFWIHAKA